MSDIRDIARRAKVSVATVSRAFNQPELLSPATLKRVRQIAQAGNYSPNNAARNLRRSDKSLRQETYTIGFIAETRTLIEGDPFAHEILEAVVSAVCARSYGLRVIAAAPGGDIPREVAQREVDGVICRFTSPMVREIARILPTVSLDCYDPLVEGAVVMPDYAGGLRMVMERLFAAGHRNVALLANDPDQHQQQGFWNIFPNTCRQAYATHGLSLPARLFRGAASDSAQGYALGLDMFDHTRNRPDAVIGPDAALHGLYRAAAERGIAIPKTLSVVGINGLRQGEFFYPPLTTLDVGVRQMGSVATKILLDNIAGETEHRGVEMTPVHLEMRGSARL